MAEERKIQQTLHPSIVHKLDPEYIAFHNSTLQYILQPDTVAWDPSFRNGPVVPGSSKPLEVAKTVDFDLTHTKVRSFTPKGEPPQEGWPVLIWFHGGGWTLGNIESETSFATNMAVRANCVVVSVDYRLAPEHPYPAAVEDAVESLDWVIKNGQKELNINTSRIAVGGSSSGGNLAAVLALKAAERAPSIPIIFQLLIVPVTDNTTSIETTWAKNQYSPWLTPSRMNWFRNNYLPNVEDRSTKWDASPIFAPKDLLSKTSPKAWVGVAELDILMDEGVQYGEKLREAGVDVEIEIYKKAPHPIMAMDDKSSYHCNGLSALPSEVLNVGKKLVSDAAAALAKAFESSK